MLWSQLDSFFAKHCKLIVLWTFIKWSVNRYRLDICYGLFRHSVPDWPNVLYFFVQNFVAGTNIRQSVSLCARALNSLIRIKNEAISPRLEQKRPAMTKESRTRRRKLRVTMQYKGYYRKLGPFYSKTHRKLRMLFQVFPILHKK